MGVCVCVCVCVSTKEKIVRFPQVLNVSLVEKYHYIFCGLCDGNFPVSLSY